MKFYTRFYLYTLIAAIAFTFQVSNAQTSNYTALNGPFGDVPDKMITTSTGDILACKNGLGIYRSTNGTNWTASNTGLADISINDIYVDGTKIYAVSYNRFYTSIDGGLSWTTLATSGFTNGRFILKGPS